MEIIGKVKHILPITGGKSAKGLRWINQDVVIQTLGDYPKHICLQFRGSLIRQVSTLQTGKKYLFHFDIEARKWQGKYFNTITCRAVSFLKE
nr:hypothetical protein AZFZUZMX_AZFZUZMX_CDS_0043 [Caudoviricetes sp.]